MDKKYEFRLSDFKIKISKNRMNDKLYVKLHGHSKTVTIAYKIFLGKTIPFMPYVEIDSEIVAESVVKAIEGNVSHAFYREHRVVMDEVNKLVRKYFKNWLKSEQSKTRVKKRENKIEREKAIKIMDSAFREKIGERMVCEILSDSDITKIKNTTEQNVLAEFIHNS